MKRPVFLIGGLILLLGGSCSKILTDNRPGNLPDYSNQAKSTVRLITLFGNTSDLMVNGNKLTNWYLPPGNNPQLPYPTPWFPASGKFSGTWFLPQQFLNTAGQATVKLYNPGGNRPDFLLDSFVVQDNFQHPNDYYTGTSPAVLGLYGTTAVPRTVSPAADPTHIRIRLVNLAQPGAVPGTLSMALADGTMVSPVTTGVGDYTWSDYVELPYGTYQFKVLIDGTNKQVPGQPPVTRSQPTDHDFNLGGTQVYYAPVRTFQPGGVYSLVVAVASGGYNFGDQHLIVSTMTYVTDVAPATNLTWARVQAVNAAATSGLSWQIDGNGIPAPGYGTAGDYQILVNGSHRLTVKSAGGQVLTDTSFSVKGGDNLSCWLYAAGGKTGLLLVPNNMSGVRSPLSNSDGSDAANGVKDPLNIDMVGLTRFLNLCPDLPYVTFTGANGVPFSDGQFSSALAAANLRPGQLPDPLAIPYPYVNLGYNSTGIVKAYASQPQVVPGDPLTNIAPLGPANFIHMAPSFFPGGNSGTEPGVYTVALTGSSKDGLLPQLIVVKHNR